MTQVPNDVVDVVKDGLIQRVPDSEVDLELLHPGQLLGPHINSIPLQNSVQTPRLFYGARFYNQALPLVNREAPLVQNLNVEEGKSYDEIFGKNLGALYSDVEGTVQKVTDTAVKIKTATGDVKEFELYKNFPFNRMSGITQQAKVKPGDPVKPNQLLATSNFTDDNGVSGLGLNARIGLVPYKGYSMDDALVVSESMANRMKSIHTYMDEVEFDENQRGGKNHFHSLFPAEYTKSQLDKLTQDGIPVPGTVLEEGDPYILATKPKMFTSNEGALGKLSRAMKTTRQNASSIWNHKEPGVVTDVAKTRKGWKVVIDTQAPVKKGDKLVLRHGQKGIISKIIPDEHMPRTRDGEPLEVLLNPLGLPSRVANAIVYELLLGKVAKKKGQAYKLPSFNGKNEAWYEFVQKELDDNGLTDREWVYDPLDDKELEQPILVGYGNYMKLQHLGEKKISGRSQGSYTEDQQPLKGGSEAAQAKRLGTLDLTALMSSGAYATMREGSTLRGQQNDNYWRALRQGQTTTEPGEPFVWDKFKALLVGSGLLSRTLPGGKERLGPFTDKRLRTLKPVEILNGGMVDPDTMDPVAGGLFDVSLVGADKWGVIPLPEPVPNPAFENQIALLLGITNKDLQKVLSGQTTLDEVKNT